MKSILRKCAVGGVVLGSALLVNPFNTANAAPEGPRAEFRKCVNAGQRARTQAENKFRKAIREAKALPREQQQAAVQAAQAAFQQAAQSECRLPGLR
jgi:hypothetical protein